jgi:hypothetical protein
VSPDFLITVHAAQRIIEVKYPLRPTLATFQKYDVAIRAAIEKLGPPWDCLVDQSALHAFAPELTPLIAELNKWAVTKGMRRTARVLSNSAIGELQSNRMLREGGVTAIATIFHSRADAWASLTKKT